MGYAGDEHDEESNGSIPEEAEHDHPPRAIPDPLDRIWMHPSELSPFVSASEPAARHRPMWTATFVAGAAGAILTLGVLGAVGAIGGSADSPREPRAIPTNTPFVSAPIVSAAAVAAGVGRSVLAVSVHDESGTRRGSGVCIRRATRSSANEVLTSNRLIGTSTHIEVTTPSGVVPARVVGRDAMSDLALLRLESRVPAARFAASPPHAGDSVWVVGAARRGATSPWMSNGLLAQIDSLVSIRTGPTTSGLLEAAAASGTASSGGALVDSAGNVAGIVLAPVGEGRMTYAVPIDTALSIADDLRTLGHARHGALGINGIDASAGPTVTAVTAGGPAERAGVLVGDVFETVDARDVDSIGDVLAIVRHDAPGEQIVVEVRRGEQTVRVRATLASLGAS